MLIQENVVLAPLTTLRVGGPARFFVRVRSREEVAEARSWAEKRSIPVFVLGGGTNVLAADEGFPGLVIKIENSELEVRSDGTVHAGAGLSMGRVVQEAVKHGLSGFEWAAGLPGTVGGAIFGNAGAFGHEAGEFIREVTAIGPTGAIGGSDPTILAPPEVQFRYRWSSFKDWPGSIIISAVFALQPGRKSEIEAAMKTAMASRHAHQPLPEQSAGCIFKNPSADEPAGKLIDECGLKGMRVGGAEVSLRHANFIVNIGSATAQDIRKLIQIVKDHVKKERGVVLEEEVRYLRENHEL